MNIIVFCLLLLISFVMSVAFSDSSVMVNWAYSGVPLTIAFIMLAIEEYKYRNQDYDYR